MKKETNNSLELKLVIGGTGYGRREYFVSHLPSERFIYFVGDDLNLVECVSGRRCAVDFIISRALGRKLIYSNEVWEREYNEKKPSPELADKLIQEVFVGHKYDYIHLYAAVQTTFDVIVNAEYFDVIFKDEEEMRKLDRLHNGLHCNKFFEYERQQFNHARRLIDVCNQVKWQNG